MGICWSSPADNQTQSTTTHLSIRASLTNSNNIAINSQFLEASDNEAVVNGQILPTSKLWVFTFAELKAATKNFKADTFIGEGAFGKVYKGLLTDKPPSKCGIGMIVAIKRLEFDNLQGFEERQSEVNFLGRLSHPNLVKLLGYCWEDKELLLVYEFVQRGSLKNHLFGMHPAAPQLAWDIRLKIVMGAARGLAFLHTLDKQIIYRYFGASNILVDGCYNAKISDFGLAKLGPSSSKSHVTTSTCGYVTPEYIVTGNLSVKSDVYGFGVVLVEILTGLMAFDSKRPCGQNNLVVWIKPYLSDGSRLRNIMDSRLGGKYPFKAALHTAQLALKCIHSEPVWRPSMVEVVETLERIQAINEKPVKPRICSTRRVAR